VNSSKLKWIIPLSLLLIILIAAVTWQIMQSRITAKAEAQLQQTLREFDWEDKVKWESLSVSPAGALTLNQVRFEYFPDAVVNMEQLRISDVIDNADRQRIRLQLKQAKSLILLIAHANKPFYITVGKIFPLTMNSFCSVSKHLIIKIFYKTLFIL